MGMVNESLTGTPKKYQPGTWTKNGWAAVWPDYTLPTTSKTQYGYRSGPLTEAEKYAIRRHQHLNRYTMGVGLADLERIYRAESGVVDPWMVNPREYTELDRQPTEYYTSCEYGSGQFWNWARCRGAFGITGFNSAVLPAAPPASDLESWGSSQIRAMRPTKPDFRLARFLGELRDANKMFRPDSYFLGYFASTRPRVRQYIGSGLDAAGTASLNWQFAVMPTASDVQRGAEAIVNSADIVRQYLRDMEAHVRRTSSRQLYSVTYTGNTGWASSSSPYNITNVNLANMTVSGIPGATHPDMYMSALEGYFNVRMEQRVFSTYRYAPENSGHLLGVLDSYVEKAQKVSGFELNLQTGWDLLPFSWMIDWFVDIGGLLGYQQDVADYKLVTKRAGYVLEWTGHGSVGLRDAGAASTNTRYKRNVSDGISTLIYKKQSRKPGNPYGLSPNWNLNTFQWGILTSLGMAWASNFPVFRKG